MAMLEADDAAKEIAREHDEIDRLSVLVSMLGAGAERDAYVHKACVRFAVHVHAEEKHLHQAMRRHVPDGANLVETQRTRDRAVLRTIEYCGLRDVEADERDVIVGQLVVGIQDHVERYDADLLPALVRACPLAESRRVGELLRAGLQAVREKVKISNGAEREPADAESAPEESHHRGLRGLLHHRHGSESDQQGADHRGYAA
jgi:hypothetical protein